MLFGGFGPYDYTFKGINYRIHIDNLVAPAYFSFACMQLNDEGLTIPRVPTPEPEPLALCSIGCAALL